MADAFIRHHLLNPAEFWTPTPLPSIAFNDPLYRNAQKNNWSGQPQGLTYQRAIRALENYGHYAEVALLGDKFRKLFSHNGGTFFSQFDPTTGVAAGLTPNGYGPTILAALEYISRMHGIHLDVEHDRVWWSALDSKDFTYTQRWGDRTWTLTSEKGHFKAALNGRNLFSCTVGVRVVTDLEGNVREVVGMASSPRPVVFCVGSARHEFTVTPNEVYEIGRTKPTLLRAAPFDYPVRESNTNRQK
jgi:hypothetical protein